MQILLSSTQAGPGRTVKQEQEEISRNHLQRLFLGSVLVVIDLVIQPRCFNLLLFLAAGDNEKDACSCCFLVLWQEEAALFFHRRRRSKFIITHSLFVAKLREFCGYYRLVSGLHTHANSPNLTMQSPKTRPLSSLV